MKIHELIVEDSLEEGWGEKVGQAWGGAMQGLGAVGGGLAGSWGRMKKGFAAGKAAVAGAPDDTAAPASAPEASDDELTQLKALIGKLNPNQKKEISSELEKDTKSPAQQPTASGTPAAPASTTTPAPAAQGGASGTTYDPAKAAADKQAKNATDAAERDAQIAATKQANAQAAQADNDLVSAVKAAKAKSGFQQTAQDKLTIRQGAAKGIHESKKKKSNKKLVVEFDSKFLNMKI